jgi:tRNA (guanine10-N2)-methyltransferase
MRCLIHFYDDWLDFRIPEIAAILKLHDLVWDNIVEEQQFGNGELDRHFYIVQLPSDKVVKAICARAVLVRAVYELWAVGHNLAETVANARLLPSSFLEPYLAQEKSWAIQVNTFGRTLSMEQKQQCREHFKFIAFQGPVNVTQADTELWLSLDFNKYRHILPTDVPTTFPTITTTVSSAMELIDSNPALPDEKTENNGTMDVPAYLGRIIARGGMKEELKMYDLKKRLYLGPTSLDDSLALILANISGVVPGMFAYDPFVGTASILIALAHFGAVCTGSDIDPRVLRGDMYAGAGDKTEDPPAAAAADAVDATGALTATLTATATLTEPDSKYTSIELSTAKKTKQQNHDRKTRNIFENFKAYNLAPPELIRMDNHRFDRHIRIQHTFDSDVLSQKTTQRDCDEGYFDVIVTDPPYGIRAGAKKSGKSRPVDYKISDERRHDHIPSTQKYPVEEVMLDLLHTAARSLVW